VSELIGQPLVKIHKLLPLSFSHVRKAPRDAPFNAVVEFSGRAYEVSYEMTTNSSGEKLVACVGYDVTDRLETERKLVEQQTKIAFEAWEKTQALRTIFSKINQGIVLIDRELRVKGDASEIFKDLVNQRSVEFQPILDLLFQYMNWSTHTLNQTMEILAGSIGEDIMAFKLNAALLPTAVLFTNDGHKLDLELDWQPIVDDQDIIDTMMIVVKDVTEANRLKEENRKAKAQVARVSQILELSAQGAQDFLVHARILIDRIDAAMPAGAGAEPERPGQAAIGYNLHTLKGNARTAGLTELAEAAQLAEDVIFPMISQQPTEDLPALALTRAQAVARVLAMKESLGAYQSTFEQLSNFSPTLQSAQHAASPEAGSADLDQQLPYWQRLARKTAEDLQRLPPNIDYQSTPGMMISTAAAAALNNAFMHFIGNSIDHGSPSGGPGATITIVASGSLDGGVTLLYRDSGEGLPIDRLRQAAVRRSALHESQVSNLDAAAMIFTDGVSTAAQVTQISGRGAGMASARSFLQEIGGRVSIQLADKENQYGKFNFALIIEIPPACVVKLAANPHRDNIWSSHRS